MRGRKMSYYDKIDPIGEDLYDGQECKCCGVEDVSYKGYCSRGCYLEDNN